MTNNDRLREIIKREHLKRRQVAELLGVSLDTVHAWLRPEGNRSYRDCPARQVEFLELKLEQRRNRL